MFPLGNTAVESEGGAEFEGVVVVEVEKKMKRNNCRRLHHSAAEEKVEICLLMER